MQCDSSPTHCHVGRNASGRRLVNWRVYYAGYNQNEYWTQNHVKTKHRHFRRPDLVADYCWEVAATANSFGP
jgi:hypothetical protein